MPTEGVEEVVLNKADVDRWAKQYADMEQMAQNMKLQNEQLQGQVQALTADQGAARIAADELRKRAQKLIQHQPKYTHEGTSKRTWQMFLSERQDFFEGHGITVDTIGEEYHKRYLMMSLQGRAREMVVGIEDELKAKNHAGMLQQLAEIFAPRFESELLKSQFKARKQRRLEDVTTYLSSKEALYRRAYAPQERTITHFMESAIAGIYNDRVKEALIMKRFDPRHVITDYMHLRDLAASCTAMEREMRNAGLPNASTSLDGLAATSLAVTRGLEEGDEEMDISKFEDRTCFKCGIKGHLAKECRKKEPFKKKDQAGKGKDKKGTFPFTCRKCGTPGHKAKDCKVKNRKVKHTKEKIKECGADQPVETDSENESQD